MTMRTNSSISELDAIMHRSQRKCGRHLAVLSATIVCAFIWPGSMLADDEQEDEQPVAGGKVVQNQFVLTPETFDSWVFNAGGNGAAP
jgi:hypothetical protein